MKKEGGEVSEREEETEEGGEAKSAPSGNAKFQHAVVVKRAPPLSD